MSGPARPPLFTIAGRALFGIARHALLAIAMCWAVLALLFSAAPLIGPHLAARLAEARAEIGGASWDGNGFLAAMRGHTLSVLATAVFAWLAWRAGCPLGRWLKLKGRASGFAFLQAALGLGTLSVCLQGLGLAGLWFPGVLAAGLLLPALAGGGLSLVPPMKRPAGSGAVLVVLAAGLLLALAGARSPQVGGAVDAMLYHFAAPEEFLRAHRIVPAPWQPQWHLPMLTEMLYGPAFALGLTEGAKTVNFLLLVLCCGLAAWTCACAGRREAGLYAAALLAGLGQVQYTVWQGKNGLGGTVFVLALAGSLLRARQAGGRSWLAAAGICAAFAVTGKPVYAIPVAALAIVLAVRIPRERLAIGALACLLAAAAWPLQNFLFTGDPVFPQILNFTGASNPWWAGGEAGGERTFLLVSHLSPAMWPRLLADLTKASALPVGSVLLAAALPWLFLRSSGTGVSRSLLVATTAAGILTLMLTGNPRYLLPVVSLLSVIAAIELRALVPSRSGRLAAGWVSLAATFCVIAVIGARPGRVALRLMGQIDRGGFQLANLTSFEKLKRDLARLAPEGKALFVGEARRLEMPCEVLAASVYAISPIWSTTRASASPDEIAKKFRQLNVSHIVYNCVSAPYQAYEKHAGQKWSDAQLILWRDFFSTRARMVASPEFVDHRNGGFYVWRMAGESARKAHRLPALPGTEGEVMRSIPSRKRGMTAASLQTMTRRINALRPKFAGIGSYHAAVGQLAVGMDDRNSALKEFEESLACGLITENNLIQLAKLRTQRLELDKAKLALDRAGRFYSPQSLLDVRAAFHLAGALVAEGENRDEEALSELEKTLATGTKRTGLLLGVSQMYLKLGQPGRAYETAKRAKKLAPSNPEVSAFLAGVESRLRTSP